MVTHRILHLIPSFEVGGAERQLTYLCEGLVRRDWEVHVGHVAGGPNLERLRRSGAHAHLLPAASNRDPLLFWRVRRLIRRLAPVAVQTWIPMMDLIGGPSARLARVPWILSERCDSAFEMHVMQIRIRAQLGRFAAAVVANSEAAIEFWRDRVPDTTRCLSIPNALPMDEIDSAPRAHRSELGIPASVPLVIAVSRLAGFKNFETLLDAFERVAAQSAAHLLICGEGRMRRFIDERIGGGVLRGRVTAPGMVANPWSWLKAADAFVSLSRFEGMPNTLLEAMAAGCPVVVSDIPHHRRVAGDDAARYAAVEDAAAVAGAILATLRDPDPQPRITAARRRVQSFTLEAVSARYAALYEAIAADSVSAGRRTGAAKARHP